MSSKAQSLIVQFIIFFTIGLSFFLLAGNLFRFQSDLIKDDIVDFGIDLAAKQMAALVITSADLCKTCENVTMTVELKPIVNEHPFVLLNNGIAVSLEAENKISQLSIHNLNTSINYANTKVGSVKPITLTFDKTNNNLVIK